MGAELQSQVQSILAGGIQAPVLKVTTTPYSLGSTNPKVINIGGAGADTITIPAPVAGDDDGKELLFVFTTAQAHVITGPVNCFNGADQTATGTAAVANYFRIMALGGVWYVVGQINMTLS